ncbi:RNA polymerase sigma factor [Actinomycetes bacterium M1A6_2h]
MAHTVSRGIPRDGTDDDLVRAAKLGDRGAFDDIVRKHGPAMYRYALNMLSDSGAAEEAVQDAFVAAWKGLDDFRSDAKLRTWLFGITAHKSIDARRRRLPKPAEDWIFETVVADASSSPEAQLSGSEFLSALRDALATLPERQRACWLLREVEGMSQVEIGQILTMSPGAVRGQLNRARTALRERMATWQ